MKLIIPHLGKPEGRNERLLRLADFLGVPCQPVLLEKGVRQSPRYFEEMLRDGNSYLVIDPAVLRECTGGRFPQELANWLVSRLPFLLIHGLGPDPFSQELVKTLSFGCLQSVRPVTDPRSRYEIAQHPKELCGAFGGISFGPVNPLNDFVFSLASEKAGTQTPISIDSHPFMTVIKKDKARLIFLASADSFDMNCDIDGKPLSEYFSRFIPYVMALRYMFGEQCWHPVQHYASFIVDDPLLRSNYGYLDFQALLRLMKQHNFATTIAFIPHNYRRSSKAAVRMFRENSDRLSICYHGNDHTAAEMASHDVPQLNAILRVAEARIESHTVSTGVPCDKVMVFPQEKFSVEAMKVLKSRNFLAAVNATHNPAGCKLPLKLSEAAQPATLRYGGFPLFLRKYIGRAERQDIAFDAFFGKPLLIVDHHEIFRSPGRLIDAVEMINSILPEIRWSNLTNALVNSTLRRVSSSGCSYIQAYSSSVNIVNDQDALRRFVVEWNQTDAAPMPEQVLQDSLPIDSIDRVGPAIRVPIDVAPRTSTTLSLRFRDDHATVVSLGLKWEAKAFIRRRLSELRDNYISKNEFAMGVAQAVKHRVLSKSF